MTDPGKPRRLAPKEKKLLRLLLSSAEPSVCVDELELIEVESIDDGGMGSLYFLHPAKPRAQRRFGKCIAETEFTDEDGIVVSAALNVDQDGDLFELDLWKTDFGPVSSLPP